VFENRVLRRIFGPKRDEVTGEWRRLYNDELNGLYCSPNIVQMIESRRKRWTGHVARVGKRRKRWTGHVARVGKRRGVYWVLVLRPEGKRPLGRPRRRWEDNIKMVL